MPVGFCCSCTSVDVRKEEGERLCGRLQSTQLGDYLVTRRVIKFLGKIPVFRDIQVRQRMEKWGKE